MAYYVSNTSGLLMEAFFDMDGVELAGQTSGEWFYLGDLHLGGDQRTEIRVERGTENKPTRADAILLIKR